MTKDIFVIKYWGRQKLVKKIFEKMVEIALKSWYIIICPKQQRTLKKFFKKVVDKAKENMIYYKSYFHKIKSKTSLLKTYYKEVLEGI